MRPFSPASLSRIEQVMGFIHDHLDQPLSVASLAALGGWSRWQFNRVFTAHTGLSVGQYVRELRLSQAAEMLLTTSWRQLDIALACGFESDVSLSRSFSQFFGCSPRQYRQRGIRSGLRTPIPVTPLPLPPAELNPRMLQIRVESRPAFDVLGVCGEVSGIFAPQPDFATKVPGLWRQLASRQSLPEQGTRFGVLDIARCSEQQHRFPYWACVEADDASAGSGLRRLTVPAQEYAVIPFQGPLEALEKTLGWFLGHWLPVSGYLGCYGYDLEVYPPGFDAQQSTVAMEYWVPVRVDRPAERRYAPNG